MRPLARRLLLALTATLLIVAAGCRSDADRSVADPVLRWVEGVTLGPEFGGGGKVCSRWVTAPTLSVFGGGDVQRKVVEDVLAHLNETLAETPIKKVELLPPDDESASVRVYFAPLAEFPSLAKKHNFKYVEGNWGYFWTFWRNNEINRAYVLLATDKLRGDTLRHFALEEITQTLGLMNDSPESPDSVFYSKWGDGGGAQQLSELDRKLIVFFYNHVRPGDGPAQVRAAYREHWPK